MAFAGFTLPDIKDSDLSDKKERRQILEYLYQLTEQLRFVLGNLDEENFTDAFKETVDTGGKLAQITQRLEDAKRGLTTVRKQTAEGFTQVASRITENEKAVAEVKQTAEGFSQVASKVAENEKAVAEVKQTAEGITQKVSRMVDKDQVVSAINQSAEEIAIQANRIDLNGAVTANQNFKINLDGSIEAKSGKIGSFEIDEYGGLSTLNSYVRIGDLRLMRLGGQSAVVSDYNDLELTSSYDNVLITAGMQVKISPNCYLPAWETVLEGDLPATSKSANLRASTDTYPQGQLYKVSSSSKYKKNIRDLPQDVVERLADIRPVAFEGLGKDDAGTNYGLIAEEVAETIPELADYILDGDGNKVANGVQYDRFVPLLIAKVQQLEGRIAALEGGMT